MSATLSDQYRRALRGTMERLMKRHPVAAYLTLRRIFILSSLPLQASKSSAQEMGMPYDAMRSDLLALLNDGLVHRSRVGRVLCKADMRDTWRLTPAGEALFTLPGTKPVINTHATNEARQP